jgi:hypothetical protein
MSRNAVLPLAGEKPASMRGPPHLLIQTWWPNVLPKDPGEIVVDPAWERNHLSTKSGQQQLRGDPGQWTSHHLFQCRDGSRSTILRVSPPEYDHAPQALISHTAELHTFDHLAGKSRDDRRRSECPGKLGPGLRKRRRWGVWCRAKQKSGLSSQPASRADEREAQKRVKVLIS